MSNLTITHLLHRLACLAATSLLIITFSLTASAQYRYNIQGKLEGGAGKKIYLSAEVYVPNADKGKIDSVIIDNNDKFKLSGKIGYAGLYALFFADQRSFREVVLDTQNPVQIKGSAEAIYKSQVSSPQQLLLEHFRQLDQPIQDSLEKFQKLAINASRQKPIDSAMVKSHVAQLNKWNSQRAAMINEFASSHAGSYAILQISENFLGNLISYQQAETYLETMPTSYISNPIYQKVNKLIAGNKATQTGMVLADFTLPDPHGKKVSTKDLREKNKYLIIDFWASWCAPCLANNPALIKLYKTYHSRQLEIVGISIDENLTSWKTALKQEDTPWLQLSDAKGFLSSSALQVDIQSIPTYLLIDSSGKLLLKTHKVEALEEALRKQAF